MDYFFRSMIESINNQLKNVFQIEHTRHRSPVNPAMQLRPGVKFEPLFFSVL
jgi:hypothetical protein